MILGIFSEDLKERAILLDCVSHGRTGEHQMGLFVFSIAAEKTLSQWVGVSIAQANISQSEASQGSSTLGSINVTLALV